MLRSSLVSPVVVFLALSPSLALGQASPAPAPGGATQPAAPSVPSGSPTPAPPAGSAPPGGRGNAPVDRGSLVEPSQAPRTAPATSAPTVVLPETRDGDRVKDASIGANPKEVYADDWWVKSRPVIEFHGYLRTRAELFHGFALGRVDTRGDALWPQPLDNSYTDVSNVNNVVALCGDTGTGVCDDKSQAGANMRFRLNPELHVSDNVRVLSQIDMLDNLVLGSTPGGFANASNATGAPGSFQTVPGSSYIPLGAFAPTQVAPTAGINSFKNSIQVKRAWGEYATPLGQLRFGRMPSHWGLGMVENSGDTYDSDWQSTVDRIMFTTGIKSLDLYFSGAWDFPNEGRTSANYESLVGGQPYDLAQLDDVNQYTAMVARRRDPELAKLDLARGNAVVNGGAYFQYREQYLAADGNDAATGLTGALGDNGPQKSSSGSNNGYVRRGFKQYTPDLWLQILYKKFRFEAEGVLVAGEGRTLGTTVGAVRNDFKLQQWGVATQTEFRAIEDRLRLQFGFGWASGDPGLLNSSTTRRTTLTPNRSGSDSTYGPRVRGDNTYSEFRFHPDYRIDLILNRNILGRVEGEYYFRPSADYDFSRTPEGQKLGGGAAIIWTRASEFIQTPGHKRDLGLEFDLTLYYQSKDGALNDNPDKMGGFFTMLQYGVLFPFGGLSHLPVDNLSNAAALPETTTAHMLRWFMGILY